MQPLVIHPPEFTEAVEQLIAQLRPDQRIITCQLPFEKWHDAKGPVDTPGKPDVGMWYGFGASWVEWCLGNDFAFGGYLEELTVRPDRVLHIVSLEEFDAFEQRYSHQPFPWTTQEWIDWSAVQKDFEGIEINPYLYERRLERIWYYGWDCASGCIWNPQALVSRKLVYRLNPDEGRFEAVGGKTP